MPVSKTNSEDVKTLARLMRAEAEGGGEEGMLMVGDVGVNRVRGNCLDFKNIHFRPAGDVRILGTIKRTHAFQSTLFLRPDE